MAEPSVKSYLSTLLLGAAVTGVCQILYSYLYRKRGLQRKQTTVLFFPDAKIACKYHFTMRHGCTMQRCNYSHDEELSYGQLMRSLMSARRSVDICVYAITCAEMADLILQQYEKGVVIRIITDYGQMEATGSQVGKFRAKGIQVRCGSASFYMHHKFALVDDCLLVNGSFNWTRNAILGNNENVQLVYDLNMVQTYKREFERLWRVFDPQQKVA